MLAVMAASLLAFVIGFLGGAYVVSQLYGLQVKHLEQDIDLLMQRIRRYQTENTPRGRHDR